MKEEKIMIIITTAEVITQNMTMIEERVSDIMTTEAEEIGIITIEGGGQNMYPIKDHILLNKGEVITTITIMGDTTESMIHLQERQNTMMKMTKKVGIATGNRMKENITQWKENTGTGVIQDVGETTTGVIFTEVKGLIIDID